MIVNFPLLFFWSLKKKIKMEVIRVQEMQHLKVIKCELFPRVVFMRICTSSLSLGVGLEDPSCWPVGCDQTWVPGSCCHRHTLWWQKWKKNAQFENKAEGITLWVLKSKHTSMEENVLWKLTEDVQPHTWRDSYKLPQTSVMSFYVIRKKKPHKPLFLIEKECWKWQVIGW